MNYLRNDNDKDIRIRNNKERDRVYKKLSDEQKAMFNSIRDNIFTYCEATAGSGKTLTAVAAMLDLLANEQINKIIYIQTISERFLQNGYLPGTIEEKTDALWTPFYDAMLTLGFQDSAVDKMVANGMILLTTDTNLRGVNFEKVGVILDEAENANTETLKLILTRCHDSCKVCLMGDSRQRDNKGRNTDFIGYGKYLCRKEFGQEVELNRNFRGKFSQAAEMYERV